MTGARDEQGFAVVAAIVVMMIVLALGGALLSFADVQQRASVREQSGEAAYSEAEAALHAQVFELSAAWPTLTRNLQSSFPTSCGPSNAGASFCPQPSNSGGAGSFGGGYTGVSPGTCPTNTPLDPWGSPLTNGWTTYVRDDGGGTASLFNSALDEAQPAYDANGDGIVWVRAVGVVGCRMVSVITRVNQQLINLNFPQDAINANGFETSNNGNKQIVDTQGSAPQPALVSVRCQGLAGPGPGTACTKYSKPGQVSPGPNYQTPAAPAVTLTATQLASVKSQAIANGTYFGPGVCPSSMSQLAGSPVYIEGPCSLSYTGNLSINSASAPGWVVLVNGTLLLDGTATFYGLIYAVNAQASSSDVVTLHGNTSVIGGITVDGNGTINFGSSGVNLQYANTVFGQMLVSGGSAETPNSFRILPQNQ